MIPNLARYLNKTVLVSIPALFEDGAARPYTLLGVEMNGLWLQSVELIDRLLRDEGRELVKLNPAVFVPFAQIAGVLVPTIEPATPPAAASKKTPQSHPPNDRTNADRTSAPRPRRS
jgi:hypothetical protein